MIKKSNVRICISCQGSTVKKIKVGRYEHKVVDCPACKGKGSFTLSTI